MDTINGCETWALIVCVPTANSCLTASSPWHLDRKASLSQKPFLEITNLHSAYRTAKFDTVVWSQKEEALSENESAQSLLVRHIFYQCRMSIMSREHSPDACSAHWQDLWILSVRRSRQVLFRRSPACPRNLLSIVSLTQIP